MSSEIEKSVEVNVPVRTAYNQWTQFEEFPKFMEGINEVRQITDKKLHWVAEIGFKEKEWDADIVEQIPDSRVAWRNSSGTPNAGVVKFEPIGTDKTRVTVRMTYSPETFVEKAGDFAGVVSKRVQGDLDRFKTFIEGRGQETGAWRGEIRGGKVKGGS